MKNKKKLYIIIGITCVVLISLCCLFMCGCNNEVTIAGIDMIELPNGNYIGKYEVTQAQWQEIMGSNPSFFEGDLSRPVENVSWDDCQRFINKLNSQSEVIESGFKFKLPTREEWEYACRAGSDGKFGYPEDQENGSIDDMGWYKENSGDETHPVGQKIANKWGIYDMHGNVWEWTSTAIDGEKRVFCGGSFYFPAPFCEASYWLNYWPDSKFSFVGLRLAAAPATK